MCHGCKLDSLYWSRQLLPCSCSEKSGSLMTIFFNFYSCSHNDVQSSRIFVSLGIVELSHVTARQCTSTPSLQNGCIFGSQDAWFHVFMLLSADIINKFCVNSSSFEWNMKKKQKKFFYETLCSVSHHKTNYASGSSFPLPLVRRLHQNVTTSLNINQLINRKCAE